MSALDTTFAAFQDYLRTWGIAATVKAYRLLDPDRIDATYPLVRMLCQGIYGMATAEALTATDEYMMLKAAVSGRDYRASWLLGDRASVPTQLPSGSSFDRWIDAGRAAIKRDIAAGIDPEKAIDLSMRRTAAEVATTVYQRPRETTFSRMQVDALVGLDEPIPADLTGYYREVETYANLWDGTSRREYRPTWERWRRVPSPGACSFCLMLAQRSNYTSADAALYAGGGEGQVRKTTKDSGNKNVLHGAGVQRRRSSAQQSGERYHRSCRCTVSMSSSRGRADESGTVEMDADEFEKWTTRDADGNLPQIHVNGHTYTPGLWDLLSDEAGISLPERAPWADAWREAPRKRPKKD